MAYHQIIPQKDESLSSFILRFAEDNHINPMDLVHKISKSRRLWEAATGQILRLELDFDFISDVFNMEDVKGTFEQLTFLGVARKFVSPENWKNYSLCLPALSQINLKYCPCCIEEDDYYNIKWQVNEITMCLRHQVRLQELCSNCNKLIPQISKNGYIGVCPWCNELLVNAPRIPGNEDDIANQIRVQKDWDELFHLESIHPKVDKYSIEEAINLGLIYLKNQAGTLSTTDKSVFKHSLSKTTQVMHFLITLRNHGVSVTQFSQMIIPDSFFSYMTNTPRKKRRKVITNEEAIKLVEDYLKEAEGKDEKISFSKISMETSISIDRIKELGLENEIMLAKNKKSEEIRIKKELELKQRFDELSETIKDLKLDKVKSSLGISWHMLKKRHPKLYEYIVDTIKKKKDLLIRERNKEYLSQIKEAIETKSYFMEKISIRNIAEITGIEHHTIRQNSELLEFIKKNIS